MVEGPATFQSSGAAKSRRGAAVLIGGEINSEIENAAAEKGAPEAKERGEKSPNEK